MLYLEPGFSREAFSISAAKANHKNICGTRGWNGNGCRRNDNRLMLLPGQYHLGIGIRSTEAELVDKIRRMEPAGSTVERRFRPFGPESSV
jgi:hypothetical protein